MELLDRGIKEAGEKVITVYGYNHSRLPVENNEFVIFNNRLINKIHRYFRPFIECFQLPSFYARFFIKRIIRKYNIDIIHFHAMQNTFLSICDIGYLAKKYKVVWTIHDTWPFTGGCMYFRDCKNWKNNQCKNCFEDKDLIFARRKNTFNNFIQKKKSFLDKDIHFVCPSKWMEENLEFSFLHNEDSMIIYNGIDNGTFKFLNKKNELKKKYGLENRVLMFSAGSIKNPYKGWRYIEEALLKLKEKEKYTVLLVGNNSEVVNTFSINFLSFGFVKDKILLNELYNTADVFIIPSTQDNFPTVVLESMMAGTPVIAFKTGGIPEEIGHNEGGITINETSSKSLAESIESFFSEEHRANQIEQCQKVSNRCKKLFSYQIMTKKYLELYHKILDGEKK